MSSLGTVEANLPPGFRFHPRDDELICDYLMKWLTKGSCSDQNNTTTHPLLIQVDLHKCEPWEIPETACVGGKEWYFYSQRDKKYATGSRTNRATISGYWKATGKDRPVSRNEALVGMRKTLVFYQGRAPKGRKTDWVMHEFRLEGPGPNIASAEEDWVLCRVFNKNKSSETAPKQEARIGFEQDAINTSLTEPYNDITLDPINRSNIVAVTINPSNDQYYHHDQQVPCFSIFDMPIETNPSFSPLPASCVDPRIISSINGGLWPNINPCSNSTEKSSGSYMSEVGLSNYTWK